jgi:hypothetical protein
MMATKQTLKLVELLNMAAEGYEIGTLTAYFDSKTGRFKNAKAKGGDRLAAFIVAELTDTFASGAIRSHQLREARLALRNAIEDLNGVVERLK